MRFTFVVAFCIVPATPSSLARAAMSSRRLVVLHGTGTSAGAFVNSLSPRGGKNFLSGIPLRVDAGGDVPPNWQWEALDADTVGGSWWEGDGFKGMEASIEYVESAIVETGSAGVIGHEQGALVAALVAARQQVPIKFAICCGVPAMPSTESRYGELLRAQSGTSVATLHCISKQDDSSSAAEEVAACFGPKAEVLWHGNGKALPGKSWWEETKGFPERATGGNRWVTQFGGPWWYHLEDKVQRRL